MIQEDEGFEEDLGPPDELYDPICEAAEDGDLDKMISLVDTWRSNIAPAEIKPGDWRFQLMKAAHKNQAAVVSWLLEQGAAIPRMTPILALSAEASPEMYQLFLDHSWDINSHLESGSPFLSHVLQKPQLLNWALAHGADPNVHSLRDYGVLDQAAATSTPAVFALLLQHGGDPSRSNPLHAAAELRSDNPNFERERTEAMMRYLVHEVGLDINARSTWKGRPSRGGRQDNGPPLHWAIQARNGGTVEWLLRNGADPESRNIMGLNAMRYAKDQGSEIGLEVLERWVAEGGGRVNGVNGCSEE